MSKTTTRIVKTIVEPSYHERKFAKKTRKPQLIDNKPAFKNTSARYVKSLLILNLMKREDKIKVEKAREKNTNVEEI